MESERAKDFAAQGATFHVVAIIEGQQTNVLTTSDWDYAQATSDQFREAGTKVRIDATFPRKKARRAAR
jgi:hypothetical protein